VAKGEDMTALNEECTGLVSKVWTWISRRGIHILDEEISGLWLLPLSNGKYRKVIPRSSSSQAYLAPTGEIGELMWKFDAKTSLKPLPLFDIGPTGLASDFVLKLTTSPDIMSKLFLKDANNIVFFLEWFDKISHLVEDAPDKEKLLLARLIASKLAQRLTSSECSIVVRALTHLKIFQKVSWKAEGDKTFVQNFSSVQKS
jgi:sacsin